jgi:hypothetical protein
MQRLNAKTPPSLQEMATEAVTARRVLVAATRDNLSALSHSEREELDAFLDDVAAQGCFATEVLVRADAVVALLQAAIERAGGAPVKRWTEEGDGYLVGGTATGHRIDCILDALRMFLRHAQAVADRLEAETQLARWREAAGHAA